MRIGPVRSAQEEVPTGRRSRVHTTTSRRSSGECRSPGSHFDLADRLPDDRHRTGMMSQGSSPHPNERANCSIGPQLMQLAYRCRVCGLRWTTYSSAGTPDVVCPFYGHDEIAWRKVA